MEYPDAAKGKCETCGYLSKHPVAGTQSLPAPRFYEIEQYERHPTGDDGEKTYLRLFYYHPDLAAHRGCKTDLVCFVGEADLMEDVHKVPDYNDKKSWSELCSVAVRTITFDRQCPAWYPYMPGFSPREHYDEQRMQAAQRDSLRVAEDSRAIVSDLKTIAEKNDRFSRRVTLWVVLLAVIQAVGTVLSLPSVSWVQRLWHHFFG